MVDTILSVAVPAVQVIVWLTLMIAIFDAARLLSLGDRTRRTIFPLVCIGLLAVLGIGASIWTHYTLPKGLYVNVGGGIDRTENFYRKFPLDSAAKFSESNAQWNFVTQGVLLNYLSETGDWKRWQPSQEQIELREQKMIVDWTYAHLGSQAIEIAWFVGASVFGACLLGWRAAKLQRNPMRP